MEKDDKSTPIKGIFILPEYSYVICINGKQIGFADDENSGISIVKSIATTEMKKIVRPATKVLSHEFHGGREIRICTRSIGTLWNGKIKTAILVNLVKVSKLKVA